MHKAICSLAILAGLTLPLAAKVPQKAFDPALLKPTSLTEKAPASFRVRFETTQGAFVVKVNRAWSPLGADRFYNLVKHGYYDGNSLFRVRPGFVVQWGIHPRPEVASAWSNAIFRDDPRGQSNTRGRVTFATGGPHTRTTQLFINLVDNGRLDSKGFTPFGEVEAGGLEVVQKFYSGYGEGAPMGKGPDQERMEREGQAYVKAQFPKLDSIKRAVILGGQR